MKGSLLHSLVILVILQYEAVKNSTLEQPREVIPPYFRHNLRSMLLRGCFARWWPFRRDRIQTSQIWRDHKATNASSARKNQQKRYHRRMSLKPPTRTNLTKYQNFKTNTALHVNGWFAPKRGALHGTRHTS